MNPRQQQLGTAARRQQVAALYLQRRYQSEIAIALGVSQQVVSYDLKMLQQEWLASSLRDFDAAKGLELQRIYECERQFWAGWSRSQQPREVSVTEATEGGEVMAPDGTMHPKGATRKASMRREGQAGDPRFLDGVLKCISQRCDILGLSTATEAAKELSQGLASLLVQARQCPPGASGAAPTPPLAEA